MRVTNVWIFFSRLSFLFSFSISLGDGSIKTEKLYERVVKFKPTNQLVDVKHNKKKKKACIDLIWVVRSILAAIGAGFLSATAFHWEIT